MGVNKVKYGENVVLDISSDTVTADKLLQGYTAHDNTGTLITGTATQGGSVVVLQDENGYVVLDDEAGETPTITSLTVTDNGTYTAPTGVAYSPITVNVNAGYDEELIKNMLERSTTFYDFEFPTGITKIGAYAFAGCQQLALTELPDTITFIDSYAFRECTNLKLTSLPSRVTAIGSYAFNNCFKLALTSLPNNGITTISAYAFADCRSITLTSIPSSVKNIDTYAFNRCRSIPYISCDGVITTLGSGAFLGSSSYPMALTSARFPNMALTSTLSTVFGSSTASNACQQLEVCDIGSTTGIAANAFANCYKLQTLVLRKSSVCTLSNVSAFLNTPMRGYNSLTGTVYVPSGLISSYKTATNWSTLYNNGTVEFVAIEGSEYEL